MQRAPELLQRELTTLKPRARCIGTTARSGNKTFVITVKGDLDYEANETVNITLSNPTDGATITPPSATTLTITNDDNPAANATFTVNTTDDLDNGACLTAHCSLREAINAANLLPDANTINFNIPGGDPGCTGGVCTINLTSALPALNSDMTINGSGASTLTVQRSTAPATPDFRILQINAGRTVTIDALTIANGQVSDSSGLGGGISNRGTLTITNSAISGNQINSGSTQFGGGIYNNGSLNLINSTLSGNSVSGGDARGGGIYINSGPVNIINSTLSGNSANGGGAGTSTGGGLRLQSGTVTITNSTVSGNSATGSPTNQGGGIFWSGGTLNIRNTIIALNNSDSGVDIFGSVSSLGHNVIGNTSGATVTPQTGDKFDAAASPLNLGPLGEQWWTDADDGARIRQRGDRWRRRLRGRFGALWRREPSATDY